MSMLNIKNTLDGFLKDVEIKGNAGLAAAGDGNCRNAHRLVKPVQLIWAIVLRLFGFDLASRFDLSVECFESLIANLGLMVFSLESLLVVLAHHHFNCVFEFHCLFSF